mmetsp:Transcript_48862/g.118288  ORF Transcript_48862/g.118288 Transcript_48862/m.118288 type:complete len:446 (-) Transcript_48862:165-1502(-)
MTATYTVVSSSVPGASGRKSGKNSNGSYNKALKGYMCDLEKRYGRIPLSPDNARIPLGLSVGGGHHGMYLLNGALHQSPYGNGDSSKSSRGQSRWSNASPVSSTNASAAHPSSPRDSSGNSSFSSHCSSLHSHMDGSERFTQRSVMEDSLPTPPIASSSRRLAAAMDYADGEDGDHDDFRAVPPIYDDEYDDDGEEKQAVPGRGSGSATGRSNTNRSRSSTTSSPSSSSSTSPRTRRKRKEKNRSHSGHSSSPSSSTKSPSSSSNSSTCRWEALVDDSSHRRGSHSCARQGGGSDCDRELDPSTLSPTKPSRSDSLVLDTLTEAIEIASSSDTTSKNPKLNRSKSSGSSRSDSNRRRGSRNSSSLSSSSSRSRLASSSFNAKAPIRKEDKDRVISPPKRSNSSSPTIRTTTSKGGSGGSSKNSNPSQDSGSSSRRVPDVFLHSLY